MADSFVSAGHRNIVSGFSAEHTSVPRLLSNASAYQARNTQNKLNELLSGKFSGTLLVTTKLWGSVHWQRSRMVIKPKTADKDFFFLWHPLCHGSKCSDTNPLQAAVIRIIRFQFKRFNCCRVLCILQRPLAGCCVDLEQYLRCFSAHSLKMETLTHHFGSFLLSVWNCSLT